MTEQQFCYWLQGFAELSGDNPPTPEQWKSIREHLSLCFNKITPHVRPAPMPIPAPMTMDDLRKNNPAVLKPNPVTITC